VVAKGGTKGFSTIINAGRVLIAQVTIKHRLVGPGSIQISGEYSMRNFPQHYLSAGAVMCLLASVAQAGITEAQVNSLGGPELTPMGAEKAANADGSIPEWTGGISDLPAVYKPGGRLVDPFAGEKPVINITAQNYQQHTDLLSEGQVAMFKRYPETYKKPVNPSHRTAIYPKKF
jgi:hypothetical protein